MPRGRGQGSAGRVGKSSVGANFSPRENMPTVQIPTITPQQGGTSSSGGPDHINQVQTLGPSSTRPIQTSGHGSTTTINLEPSPNTPNQSNTIGDGGSGVATGTHTCGSISVGEHLKRLAVKKGRDPTPSELYLHVHTHGNNGKSFVAEKSQIVHEKYQEIL
ncbi:uncharacterized protein LOC107788783 [Nicotiana tabacum]|uniref:Uncharacterized protein LOC107788783 n=4 Tax=Nicotiana tabacum TaxID=4097 RepID=A0AC58U4R9_TOBAC